MNPSTALALIDDRIQLRRANSALPAVRRADVAGAALVRADAAAGPPPKYSAIANERWLLVKRFEGLLHSGRARTERDAAVLISRLHAGEFQVIRSQIAKPGACLANARRWRAALGKHGNGRINYDNREALMPRWARGRRERAGDAFFWEQFAGAYEHANKLSFPTAYEVAAIACRSRGITDLPKIGQVRNWYKHPDVRLRANCARLGEEWAKNHVVGHIRRIWDDVEPNAMWVGDHHVFDCLVKMLDEATGQWVAKRPWFTVWMDARALAILGWVVRTESPNHVVILEALRDAIMRNGCRCAESLHTDHGADYGIQGFTTAFTCPEAPGVEIRSIDDLGCTVRRSNPYNARAKTVERLFGVVCGMFSKLWPSYLGNRPDARPEVASYFYAHPEELPTIEQFRAALEAWIDGFYHTRRSHGRILAGKSPAEAWTRGTGGPLLDIATLRLGLAVPAAVPVVRAGGVVVADNREWQARELLPYIQSKVILRLDRVNNAAFACNLKGELICELEQRVAVAAIARGEDAELLSAQIAEQKRHREAIAAAITEATGGTEGLAPADRMAVDWSRPLQLQTRGTQVSVTGATHLYRRRVAVQAGRDTSYDDAPPPAAARVVDKQDDKQAPVEALPIADLARWKAERAAAREPRPCAGEITGYAEFAKRKEGETDGN